MGEIIVILNSKFEVELWQKKSQLWFKWKSKTPKSYADAEAKFLNKKPDYGHCWWGMGETHPQGEIIGRVTPSNKMEIK